MGERDEIAAAVRRKLRRRRLTVAIASAVTLLLCAGYVAGDAAGLLPGILTTQPVSVRQLDDAGAPLAAADIAGDADTAKAIDAGAAGNLIDELVSTEGVGSDVSVAIAQADGTIVASKAADTAREPASTMKTLTALAAASVLDMGSTLSTDAYLEQTDDSATIVLQGHGDMLLGSGESDANHVNGRAGLGTLAEETAKALKARGIGKVSVAYDDSLFGNARYPSTISQNNGDHLYYTGVSSMAIDGGRQWNGAEPDDPDTFEAYPVLSQRTAVDAAESFAASLEDAGIEVDGSVSPGSAPSGKSPLASVESAPLSSIMMFMLRHSDNTLAEEFGRLLALATGESNSPAGATAAVKAQLKRLGVPLDGLVMADCSGLSPGSKATVKTLVAAQVRNLDAGIAVAAAEGLSVAGLVGTASGRLASPKAAGLLRVKTGSLDTVTSMTGNVSREHGGVAAFSVIINDPSDYAAAREAITTFVSGVAGL